jgi:hypothetical protein
VKHAHVANSYAIAAFGKPQEVAIASFVWHSKELLQCWYELFTLAKETFTVDSGSVPTIGL